MTDARPLALLVLGALLFLSACDHPGGAPAAASAPEAAETRVERGPVRLTVSVAPKQARLSDEPVLTLTLESEPGVTVKKPPFGQSLGDFVVRDFSEPLPETRDGKQILRQIYTLEPMRTGTLRIHPIPIRFVDRDGQEHTFESEALEIEVESVLGAAVPSLDDARPAAAPVGLPRPLPWQLWAALAAFAIAGAGRLVLHRLRARRAAAPVRVPTPQELAAEELRALLASGLMDRDVKLWYVELTAIVRRFIERTTGIRAPEQTTEEFLREIGGRDAFPADTGRRLRSFLETADLVKFAGHLPRREDVEESCRRARAFLGLEPEGRAA